VALTFDAEHPDRPLCPPRNADGILDRLREAGARGSFFIQGRWAEAYPETTGRIAREGHVVGNHSNYHVRMPLLSDEGLRVDVCEAEERIFDATGIDPKPWFRCPFGAGHDDPHIVRVLADLGYRDVRHHVEVEDWEPWRTAGGIAEDIVRGARRHGDGAVVLLHTWPGAVGEALPRVLDGLGRAGARFVGVDELEDLP
jgi:peptidoglycan/xylan/chitin deacetylase (PgdA/CDA1 family)